MHLSLKGSLKSVGSRLDPLVQAFKTESGATDLSVTNALIKAIRAEGLIDNCRVFPMKSAGNAGANSTAYGVGGLTTNNITAAGDYTWNLGGMSVQSNSRLDVTIAGLQSFTDLTVISVQSMIHESEANNGQNDYRWSWGSATTQNRLGVASSTSSLTDEVVSFVFDNGTSKRFGSTLSSWDQTERLVEATQFSDNGTAYWLNGASFTIDRASGGSAGADSSPLATGYTGDDVLNIASRFGTTSTNGFHGSYEYVIVFNTKLTTAQHLAINNIVRNLPVTTKRIVFWGDSLTETKHLGYTNSAATIRITPPSQRMKQTYDYSCYGKGISGETAAEIATRATAQSTYNDYIHVIWAGTNDKDNADESAVVDEIASIVTHIGHTRFLVVTPIIKPTWTATQITNVTNIRTEIISRYPNNYVDSWVVDNTTDGTPDTGFRRYNSAATEDGFHPNDLWYSNFIPDLNTFITGKGWL